MRRGLPLSSVIQTTSMFLGPSVQAETRIHQKRGVKQ